MQCAGTRDAQDFFLRNRWPKICQCVAKGSSALPLAHICAHIKKFAYLPLVVSQNGPDDQGYGGKARIAMPKPQEFIAALIAQIQIQHNAIGQENFTIEAFFEIFPCRCYGCPCFDRGDPYRKCSIRGESEVFRFIFYEK